MTGDAQPCGRRHDPDQPCRRCADARRAEQDRAVEADAAQAAERAAAAEVRRRCRACDEQGWLDHDDLQAPAIRCDHERPVAEQLADALDHAT